MDHIVRLLLNTFISFYKGSVYPYKGPIQTSNHLQTIDRINLKSQNFHFRAIMPFSKGRLTF